MNSQVIECGAQGGGLGVGSCCSIAAALTAALQSPFSLSFETLAHAARMMRLAQRLTPLSARAQESKRGDRTKVVLVTTATGSYNRFVLPLLQSARKYLLPGPAYEVYCTQSLSLLSCISSPLELHKLEVESLTPKCCTTSRCRTWFSRTTLHAFRGNTV